MTRLAMLLALAFVVAACADAASESTTAPATPAAAAVTPDAVPVATEPAPSASAPAPAVSAPAADTSPAAAAERSVVAILASSETAIGPNRFLFGLVEDGESIAAPDVSVGLRFFEETDPDTLAFETDGRFLWAIEDVRGLYAADVAFPRAGRWGTLFDVTFPDGTTAAAPLVYSVRETTSTPAIGAPAPAAVTPTLDDAAGDLSTISTDSEPVERLYERSLDVATESGEPFIVAFVTPAFCQTATCGPTLDKVKEVADANPELDFLHLEPYVMAMKDDRLQPVLDDQGQLQSAEWTQAWGLLTEPFVAVVDADGNVSAKFEGAITTEELQEAIAAL